MSGPGGQPASEEAAAAPATGGKKPAAKECGNFEPQTWRKNVCKNCFRMKSQHSGSGGGSSGVGGSGGGNSAAQPRRQAAAASSATSTASSSGGDASSSSTTESPPSGAFRKLGGSGGTSSTGSPRSSRKSSGLERTPSGKSLSSSPSGSRRTTPESKRKDYGKEEGGTKTFGYEGTSRSRSASKESLRSTTGSSRGHGAGGSSFDEKYVEDLENDLFDMEDKFELLCREKANLEAQLEERLGDIEDLEAELESCRAKISGLEKRVAQLEQEIKSYRERLKLPESDQSHQDVAPASSEGGDSRAQELEDLCQELMEENDQLKEEVEELQKELSEMHDSFQDEDSQANTVRELQRELDAANKSYRVIQFKLRKAERRFDQCESERAELEDKFRRLGERMLSGDESVQIQELEDELRMAKEVSVRLHDELEFIEEKRIRLESENQKLKFELESSERERIRLENDIDRARLELDKVKSDAGISDSGPLQVIDKSSPRPRLGQVVSRESSIEEDHLKRELTATRERETDLVEQLRFSKEEIKILKRKLEEAEEENEGLTVKLHKLAGGEAGRIRFGSDDSMEVELDEQAAGRAEQLEREASALRRKVADLDKENQTLRQDVTELETQLEEAGMGHGQQHAAAAGSGDRQRMFKYNTLEAQNLLSEIDKDLEEMKRKVTVAAQLSTEDFSLQEKWIEASEAKKQLELKVTELRRRVAELEGANSSLKLEVDKLDGQKSGQQQKGGGGGGGGGPAAKKSIQELENATKAELIREVGDLEDEVEDLLLMIKKSDSNADNVQQRLKTLDEELQKSRRAYEEDERFFIDQLEKLQKQNELMGDLLSLVTLRRRFMYDYESSADSSSSEGAGAKTTPTATGNGKVGGDLSDEVFGGEKQQDLHYWDKKFRERLQSLEQLLKEERQRTRHYQKRLETLSEDQKREEKDNEKYKTIIEGKDTQLKECQAKLDQSRKMYEALKLLVDDTESPSRPPPVTTQSRIEDRSRAMESQKAEAAELKKRHEQLLAKVGKMEKEKAAADKNAHILNEELKLREEHIFEQDDMIRGLQRKLQEADREFERLKNELHQLKSQFSSVKEKNTESARLKEELHKCITASSDKERQLTELRQQLEERKSELAEADERLRGYQEAVRNRDDRIREKDELIGLINTRLANREREISDLDGVLKQANQKLTSAEAELAGLRVQVTDQEKEGRGLRCQLEEAQAGRDWQAGELAQLRQRCDQLSRGSEQAKEEAQRRCADLRRERDEARGELEQARRDLVASGGASSGAAGSGLLLSAAGGRLHAPLPGGVLGRAAAAAAASADSGFQSVSSPASLLDRDTEAAQLPMDIQVRLKHLEQVEKIYLQLTHQQITLKLQVEAYQREVEEFRELYYSTRERMKNDKDDWLQERDSLQRELHKSSQSSSSQEPSSQELRAALLDKEKRLVQLEEQLARQALEQDEERSRLQRENLELKSKAGAFVEERKMPKVLQRFAGSKKAPIVAGDAAFEAERAEYQARMGEQEKKLEKLRKDVKEMTERLAQQSLEKLDRWGQEVLQLSQKVDEMQLVFVQADGFRRDAAEWRSRAETLQDTLLKDRKRWQGEKVTLQYAAEQFRVMLDQWLDRFLNAVDDLDALKLENTEDLANRQDELRATIKLIVDDIVKFKTRVSSQDKSLTRQGKMSYRSALNSTTDDPFGSTGAVGTTGGGGGQGGSSDFAARPTSGSTSSAAGQQQQQQQRLQPAAFGTGGLGNRSISMDWSTATRSLLRAESPFRSKRSASPDVSVKKVTNFPDPTPGFWIKPSSRTNSRESLNSSQTNLTFPTVRFSPHVSGDDSGGSGSTTGLSKAASSNAAARRRFYQAYDEQVYASSERLLPAGSSAVGGGGVSGSVGGGNRGLSRVSEEMSRSTHEEAAPPMLLGGEDKRDLFAKKSHSLDLVDDQQQQQQQQQAASAQSGPPSQQPQQQQKQPQPQQQPQPQKSSKPAVRNPFGVTLKSVRSPPAPQTQPAPQPAQQSPQPTQQPSPQPAQQKAAPTGIKKFFPRSS